MMQAPYERRDEGRIHVFDAAALPWQDTPEPGLRLKPVRYDDERGQFLGLAGFEAMTLTGLHQHRGVASSFVIAGALTDYHGSIRLYDAGINLHGATHDAIAYEPTVLVSRLEGPVAYPHEHGDLSGLHAGSRHAEFVNPAPEVPPEINVVVDALDRWQTGVPGLQRQTIFDYAGTASAHRYVQLRLAPGCVCPPWRATALTEYWVRGGRLEIDRRMVHANCFVVVERGATVQMASPFGALLLAWAEGPEDWVDSGSAASGSRARRCSLFGF